MDQQHGNMRKRLKKSTPFLSIQLTHHNQTQTQTQIQIQIPQIQFQNQNQMSIIPSSSSSSSSSSSPLNSSSSSSPPPPPPDLPCSILMDVLSRLPIKTLMQCSYVCKTWRNLLSESYLYRLYCLHTPTTLILQVKGSSLNTLKEILLIESPLLMIDGDTSSSSLIRKMRLVSNKNHHIHDIENDNLDEEPNWVIPNFRFQLGNGCNGLVCLREIRTREPRLVWNPIMGQYVMLPKPGSVSGDKVVAGFGFCSRSNRYKVVRIFHGEFDPPSKRRVEIYDLGVGNEWRGIGECPFPIPSRIPGFYTNNCLHWIIESPGLICCFDFIDEVFRKVADPPIYSSGDRNKYHWSNLGILGGGCLSICAIDAKIFRPDVQVWVMEEYGVAESWALRLSIRDPTVDWWDPYRWIQVTNFLRNGEILMLCGHCYVLAYNLRERRFRSIEGLDFPAIAHVPSFISLEDVLREDLGTGSLIVRYL